MTEEKSTVITRSRDFRQTLPGPLCSTDINSAHDQGEACASSRELSHTNFHQAAYLQLTNIVQFHGLFSVRVRSRGVQILPEQGALSLQYVDLGGAQSMLPCHLCRRMNWQTQAHAQHFVLGELFNLCQQLASW